MPPQGVIFGSPLGHLRDPPNTAGDLREVLDGIRCHRCDQRGWLPPPEGQHKRLRCDAGPFFWVTSHVFRKTLATRLDDARPSARQIADQLGHARPSLTQDVYMGRRRVRRAGWRDCARRPAREVQRRSTRPRYRRSRTCPSTGNGPLLPRSNGVITGRYVVRHGAAADKAPVAQVPRRSCRG